MPGMGGREIDMGRRGKRDRKARLYYLWVGGEASTASTARRPAGCKYIQTRAISSGVSPLYTQCTLTRRGQIESHGLMPGDALYGWCSHMRKEPLRSGGDSNATVEIHAEHVRRGPVEPIHDPFPRELQN